MDNREYAEQIATEFSWPRSFAVPFLLEWMRCENTDAENNPLALTQAMPESTQFNSASVQNYATEADAVQAAVWTLDPRSYDGIDYYPNVRRALERAAIGELRPQIVAEIHTYGTHAFADEINGGWNPDTDYAYVVSPAQVIAEPESETLLAREIARVEAMIQRLNTATLARFAAVRDGDLAAAANPDKVPGE